MTRCVGVADSLLVVPPVSNHDSLRRREAQYLEGVKLEDSGSIVGYPTLSGSPLQSALPLASAVAFSSIPPLLYLTRDTVRASATAFVTTPVESARTTYNTAPDFITASPVLFTGDGLKVLPSMFFLFSATISGLYLAV
ncbi:8e661d66-1cb6-4a55-9d4b-8adf054641f4 [Sclerotinia trifoliorum]|uniref:8e661d66-1cb6-4a55-9d4b-8adf054641f4 n=1 Tax=Sclerotinia trifoliorum TaxID=28548 RepID=A0A8H2W1D2_9HELO|nr:8e661d66-1cb6-4a55-9d4b-8adf054641f4 [Sclerotinia trifoliorum]